MPKTKKKRPTFTQWLKWRIAQPNHRGRVAAVASCVALPGWPRRATKAETFEVYARTNGIPLSTMREVWLTYITDGVNEMPAPAPKKPAPAPKKPAGTPRLTPVARKRLNEIHRLSGLPRHLIIEFALDAWTKT